MNSVLHPLMATALGASASEAGLMAVIAGRLCDHVPRHGRLIGHGGEGFVFAGEGRVTKVLVNWTHPHRDPDRTEAWLRTLALASCGANHLYPFSVSRPASDVIVVCYEAEVAVPLTDHSASEDWQRIRPQLLACFDELARAGFAHTNPRPANFAWDGGVLKLIDYGSDCRPLAEAASALARMQFMWSAGFYDRGDE